MISGLDYYSVGEWLRETGPERDVVISTRVRFARNIHGFKFTNRADRAEQQQLVTLAKLHTMSAGDGQDSLSWIDLLKADDLERTLLSERHLISRQLAKANNPRAAVVNKAESIAIMVNEEDHFRMQVIRSGLQLRDAYEHVNRIDDRLSEHICFSFHRRFGYLTACPTNVGTGIRISVMLHLPALTLTNEIERVRRAAKDMQLAVRGFYGEGSDAVGDLYQISNQTTLGKAEPELLDEFDQRIIPQVIGYERRARQMLVEKRSSTLDDKCFRALGVLQNARLIKADEAMRLLSHLRLGIETGRISGIDSRAVTRMFLYCQPAHLQIYSERSDHDERSGQRVSLNQVERSEARARMIREELDGV